MENRTDVRGESLQTMRETSFPFPTPTSEPVSTQVPTVTGLSDWSWTAEGLVVLVTIVHEGDTTVWAEPGGENSQRNSIA